LIVIGTALQTGGARRVVNQTLERQEVPVIEFNLEPNIDEGFALHVTEKCETSLDAMFDEYYRLLKEPKATASQLSVAKEEKKKSLSPGAKTTNGGPQKSVQQLKPS
jgi:hypothetical protein